MTEFSRISEEWEGFLKNKNVWDSLAIINCSENVEHKYPELYRLPHTLSRSLAKHLQSQRYKELLLWLPNCPFFDHLSHFTSPESETGGRWEIQLENWESLEGMRYHFNGLDAWEHSGKTWKFRIRKINIWWGWVRDSRLNDSNNFNLICRTRSRNCFVRTW